MWKKSKQDSQDINRLLYEAAMNSRQLEKYKKYDKLNTERIRKMLINQAEEHGKTSYHFDWFELYPDEFPNNERVFLTGPEKDDYSNSAIKYFRDDLNLKITFIGNSGVEVNWEYTYPLTTREKAKKMV